MRQIRIATRRSPLALAQAHKVAGLLSEYIKSTGSVVFNSEIKLHVLETSADKRLDVSIRDLGASGAFVKEIEKAVLLGEADCAVHSAKDLPSSPGSSPLSLVSVPERADPRDVLVGCSLDLLPQGAQVATGSLRRKLQILALRPDLEVVGIRGNIATRLSKIPHKGAVIMAKAALDRLGIQNDANNSVLSVSQMLPQVGQGALAVTCMEEDKELAELLGAVSDENSSLALQAERAFLAAIGGGCDAPVGAYAVINEDANTGVRKSITLQAMLATADHTVIVKRSMSGQNPLSLGKSLAIELIDIVSGYNGSQNEKNLGMGKAIYTDEDRS